MFTHEYLQSLTTATVFGRGKDCFRAGSVGRITREGDKFTAKVHGSFPYKVQLTLKPDGARLKCACPYEVEGICKHAVALGLAVLQKFGSSLAASKPASAPAFSPTTPAAQPVFIIDSISTEVYEALSGLVFDDELLHNYDREYISYRYDKDDTLLEAADEAIEEVLLPHADAVAEALHEGRLAEGLRRWVGVYEGSAAATEPATDDHDLFGYMGYPAHVQARWQALLADQEIPQLLEAKQFDTAETEAALALLAGRYGGEQTKGQGACEPKQAAAAAFSGSPLRIPPHFHDLLHALAHDPATAAQLRSLLAAGPAPDLGLARVLLRVAEVLADDALWLRTSEALAAHDATLTVQLLDRYRACGDHASLRRVLHERRAQFAPVLNAYILKHLTLADDETLYLMALEQRCRHTHSLADYHLLQSHWSPAQRRSFVDEQVAQGARAGSDPLFGASTCWN